MRIGSVSIEIHETEDAIYLHALEGVGDVADMRTVVLTVRKLAKQRKVYLMVDYDNPRMEQLMKRYESLGAKPLGVLMEVL